MATVSSAALLGNMSPDAAPDPTPAVPFAAIPHAIASDTRLSPTDRLLVVALVRYAMADQAECWPSNESLAEYLGISYPTAVRSLRAIEKAGHIHCETIKPNPSNPTGRVIHLRWRTDRRADPFYLQPACFACLGGKGSAPVHQGGVITGDNPPLSPVTGGGVITGDKQRRSVGVEERALRSPDLQRCQSATPTQPAAPEQPANPDPGPRPDPTPPEVRAETLAGQEEEKRDFNPPLNANGNEEAQRAARRRELAAMFASIGVNAPAVRQHLNGSPPAAPGPKPAVAMRPGELKLKVSATMAAGKPETEALLREIRQGCSRDVVEQVALRLCCELKDQHSKAAYCAAMHGVRKGHAPPEVLIHAYRRACGPKVRNRGAAFVAAIKESG